MKYYNLITGITFATKETLQEITMSDRTRRYTASGIVFPVGASYWIGEPEDGVKVQTAKEFSFKSEHIVATWED